MYLNKYYVHIHIFINKYHTHIDMYLNKYYQQIGISFGVFMGSELLE